MPGHDPIGQAVMIVMAIARLASFYGLKGGALITSVSRGYGEKKIFNCLIAIRSANGCITRIVSLFVLGRNSWTMAGVSIVFTTN